MATLKCPNNVTSITTVTSGIQSPVNNRVTVTDAEFTDICSSFNSPHVRTSDIATGNLTLFMAASITSFTINGNTYAVTAGVTVPMNSVDGTQVVYEGFNFDYPQ